MSKFLYSYVTKISYGVLYGILRLLGRLSSMKMIGTWLFERNGVKKWVHHKIFVFISRKKFRVSKIVAQKDLLCALDFFEYI